MRTAFSTLMEWPRKLNAWETTIRGINGSIVRAGYPSLMGTVAEGAPFELLADRLRGDRGIIKEHDVQPEESYRAIEALLPGATENLIARRIKPSARWSSYRSAGASMYSCLIHNLKNTTGRH
jgi:hypothetical protein